MNIDLIRDLMKPNDEVISKYENSLSKINPEVNEVTVEKEIEKVLTVIDFCKKDILIKPSKLELLAQAKHLDIINNCKQEQEEIDRIDKMAEELQNRINTLNEEVRSANTLSSEEYNKKLAYYQSIKDEVQVLSKYKTNILFILTFFNIKLDFNFSINDIDKVSLHNRIQKLNNVMKYNPTTIVNTIGSTMSLLLFLVIALTPLSDIFLVCVLVCVVITLFHSKQIVSDNKDIIYALFANESNADLVLDKKDYYTEESPEFVEETNKIEEAIKKIKRYEYLEGKIQEELETNWEEYEVEVNKIYAEYESKVDGIINKLNEFKSSMEEFKDKYIKEHVYLVDYCNNTVVMDQSLRIGRTGIAEANIDIKDKNIIVKDEGDEIIQALIPAFISSTLPGHCKLHIIDPNNMGVSVADYYRDSFKDFFIFESKSLDECLKEAKAIMQDNIKSCKSLTVQNYNINANSLGSTSIDYNVYFILSQGKDQMKKEEIQSLLESSVNQGVIIVWKTMEIPESIDRDKVLELTIRDFTNVKLYNFNTEERTNFTKKVEETRKAAGSSAVLWGKDFIWRICPPEKEWKFSSLKGVDMYPGFVNGDPTQIPSFGLSDENVHGLSAGTTGAGKSVLLNHLIGTLCRCYSPLELELWLCDFKGSEFSSYIASERYPHALPHIKCCLCTSDGAYASSVMDALKKESERRYAQLMEYSISNFKNWNIYCDNQKQSDTSKNWESMKWPRIVMIADEFQNMFQAAEDDQVEVIVKALTYVAKIGRQCGVHMFFASQSMSGTLSSDVLNQFSLRYCLRASADVSESLIGCDYAANMPAPKGWLYVKNSSMYRPEQLQLIKTPWINDDETLDDPENEGKKISEKLLNVRYLAQKAEVENIPKKDNVVTYIEKTKHPLSELDKYYEKAKDKLSEETSLIIFGERMAYNVKNPGPLNRQVLNLSGENIYSQFNNQIDYIDFTKQLLTCLKQSGVEDIIVSVQDSDMAYLCEIDKMDFIKKVFDKSITPLQIIETLEANIAKREESNNRKQMWVILLGWNKAEGVGINEDYEVRDRIYNINMKCPEKGIHLCYICNGDSKINTKVISSCNVKIAGKVSESASFDIIDKKWASRDFEGIKDGYMYVKINETITRCKIYQAPKSDREVKATEFIL